MQTLVLADFVSDQIKMHVADPLLNVATVLIPAVVLLSGLHKMMDHRESVFSTCTRIFNVLNERSVAQSAASSRFDPDQLITRSGTLYLCSPREVPERVASLFVGILMSAVTRAYAIAASRPRGRLEPPLGLFLDELANVIPIDDLPSLASQGAGRGVLLMSIVQDFSQLRARYGVDKAHSILNNHPCKVVLPGISDPETCDQLGRLVGRTAFTDVAVSEARGGVSRSFSVRHEPMASPDALRQLPAGSAIIVDRGRPPALVRLRPWWQSGRMRRLSSQPYLRNAEHVRETAAPRRPARATRSLTSRGDPGR